MKRLFTLLLIVTILAVGLWQLERYLLKPTAVDSKLTSDKIYASPTLSQDNKLVVPIITIEATQSGQTAFELLQATLPVAYKEYKFGVFIESINGVAGDEDHYWALYLNDQYSQQAADQLVLKAGDVVEFRYEKLKKDLH